MVLFQQEWLVILTAGDKDLDEQLVLAGLRDWTVPDSQWFAYFRE
jgi:hypothetical protein